MKQMIENDDWRAIPEPVDYETEKENGVGGYIAGLTLVRDPFLAVIGKLMFCRNMPIARRVCKLCPLQTQN